MFASTEYHTVIPAAVPANELETYCNRDTTLRADRELAVLLLRAELGDLDLLELDDLRSAL